MVSKCDVCNTSIPGVPGCTTCNIQGGCSCSHGAKIEGVSSNILLEFVKEERTLQYNLSSPIEFTGTEFRLDKLQEMIQL